MSDLPIAAHTFDFKRVYVSTRTSGVPGSGVWTTPVAIFDYSQNVDPVGDGALINFSAGALESGDDFGIVGQVQNSLDGSRHLAYIGNGVPAAPVHLTFPGALPTEIYPVDYWEIYQGFFTYNGAKFGAAIVEFRTPTRFDLQIYKTVDELAFSNPDSGNSPLNKGADVSSGGAIQRIANYIYGFFDTTGAGTNWAIFPFNMQSQKWEPSFAPLVVAINNFGLADQSLTNDLYRWPNGDFSVLYTNAAANMLVYRLWTAAGGWGAEVVVHGVAGWDTVASIIDPDLLKLHVFVTFSGLNPVYEYTVTQAGIVALAGTIPAPVRFSDEAGHPSIQGGLLFVPRDDAADFDNSVWVRSLPAGAYQKELLPIPPGETATIKLAGVGNPGTGYVLGDTGTIDGGAELAGYLVTGVNVNVIAAYSFSTPDLGTGYVVGDQGTINPGAASFQITAVGGSGEVLGLVLINNGAGYFTGLKVTTTTFGVGAGLKISVDAVANGVYKLTINPAGGGYSVANNIGTTPGGAQPGVGVGLTIDIGEISGKTPSCAYMMYPNGYDLSITPAPALLPLAPVRSDGLFFFPFPGALCITGCEAPCVECCDDGKMYATFKGQLAVKGRRV